MGKVFQTLKNKELFDLKKMDYRQYKNEIEGMSEDEINEKYTMDANSSDIYYKRIPIELDESEMDSYLLYQILKSQRNCEKKIAKQEASTTTIKNIIVTLLVLGVIGGLITIIQYAKLLSFF